MFSSGRLAVASSRQSVYSQPTSIGLVRGGTNWGKGQRTDSRDILSGMFHASLKVRFLAGISLLSPSVLNDNVVRNGSSKGCRRCVQEIRFQHNNFIQKHDHASLMRGGEVTGTRSEARSMPG